ncbi:unnamed protein product, partial [marine sediment metagenome]
EINVYKFVLGKIHNNNRIYKLPKITLNMEIEKLEQLGLDIKEAKIYLALLELKESQVGELSKKAQINRTTTYDILDRLIEKGLVAYVISARKKVFKPTTPKRLLEQIKEKEKIAEEILPDLNEIFMGDRKEEEADIYKGKKGIKTILGDILNYKSYVTLGSSGEFLRVMEHDFVIFQKKKKNLGIKSRIIQSNSARKNKELRKVAYATFKYISDEFSSPNTSIIYGNKLAIIVWAETPIATVITSKQVADSFKNILNYYGNKLRNNHFYSRIVI